MLPNPVRKRQQEVYGDQPEPPSEWLPCGIREAEQVYCVLFFVGWVLVFGRFFAQLLVYLDQKTLMLDLLPNVLEASQSQCLWEVATGLAQLLSHLAWYWTLLSSANRSHPSRWFSCLLSGFVVPLGIILFGHFRKKQLGMEGMDYLPDVSSLPLLWPLHRVLFYKVGWEWHVPLLLCQAAVETYYGPQLDLTAFGIKVIFNLVLPFGVPYCIEEKCGPGDTSTSAAHAPKHACDSEPNSDAEEVTGRRAIEGSTNAIDESPASVREGNAFVRTQAEVQQRVDPPKKAAPLDVSQILRTPCGDKSLRHLINYKSSVGLDVRAVKVHKKNASSKEIQEYAEQFAANLSRKKMKMGKLTLVKCIGIRGCILLVAGLLDSSDTSESVPKSFHDEAMEIIDCLSYDLRLEEMDITIGGMTGRFVDGEIQSVKPVDRNVNVPEVILVQDPCVIKGQKSTVEVYFSNSSEEWASLNAISTMHDTISQKNLLCGSDNQHIITTIEAASNQQNGHIRAVGVLNDNQEGPGTTFVGAMTPLLVLPKSVAYELNGLFTNTVSAIGPDDLESRKTVWQEFFRHFSLDIYYILEFTTADLSNLIATQSHARQEYTRVLCSVIELLRDCNAMQTIQHLLQLVDGTGVELVADGMDLAEQLGVSLDKNNNEEMEVETLMEAGPSECTQSAEGQPLKGKGTSTDLTASDVDTRHCVDFSWWNGFADPVLETQYRVYHKRRTAKADIVGTVMGICLVPLMWQLVRNGKAMYLSPVITQFFICNFWLVLFRRTYVHNRQPVMVLHWAVRLVAFAAQSVHHKGWPSLGMPSIWNYLLALLTWTVIIKPRVMKMLLRDHVIFSICDLVSWIGIVVINFFCGDVMSGLIPAMVAMSGTVFSCIAIFWAEQADRRVFATKFEGQSLKLSSSK